MRPWTRTLSTLVVATAALALTAPANAGSAPVLQFLANPAPTFGDGVDTVAVGDSLNQTFTLKNTGGSASAAVKVTLAPATAFTIPAGADRCTGVALGPGKTCTVTVRYTPAAAGADDTATLTASAKKPATSATLTLTGSSPADPTGQCWAGFYENSAQYDVRFVGPINALDNGDVYESTDGTCTGDFYGSFTIVKADSALGAAQICSTLILTGYDRMDAYTLNYSGYAAAPADFWYCSPYQAG